MARRFTYTITVFVIGVALFILGVYLVQDLILKFLKFAVGLFLIFISIPMIFGSVGWRLFRRKGRVVRFYRD
jgi:uncharacterized membrane protein YfcA